MRVGYVPGVFDLLHVGHLNLLQRAADQVDHLIVGVVSDEGTAAYKRRPVHDEQTRLAVVRALRMVDEAQLQATTDPTPELEGLRPHVLFHGDDWAELKEGQATLARLGIEFVLLPYTRGVSSSEYVAELVARGEVMT